MYSKLCGCLFCQKHALWPAHTVSQMHECTVAHIAMLLLAKARPHNVSHSSSLHNYHSVLSVMVIVL